MKLGNFRFVTAMILLCAMLNSCYYLKQGSVLISQRLSAQSFDAAVKHQRGVNEQTSPHGDAKTQEDLSKFFERVGRIRAYGTERLGLSADKNFTRYIEIDGDYLVAVVNAAAPDSLEPYLWHYPFFGPAPYRGYFDTEDARDEARRLRDEGYEVLIRPVDAFSTLGITRDPLYSFMADYSEFQLAELIFHEQIHATLWVKGHIQFNEELATALGRRAALDYLQDVYGSDSQQYQEAVHRSADSTVFTRDVNRLAQQLDELYARDDMTEDELLEEKEQTIHSFQEQFLSEYDQRYSSDGYRSFGEMEINNAYLSLFRTYSGRSESYLELYEFCGSVNQCLELLSSAMENPEYYGLEYSKRKTDPYRFMLDIMEAVYQRNAS